MTKDLRIAKLEEENRILVEKYSRGYQEGSGGGGGNVSSHSNYRNSSVISGNIKLQ